VASRNKPISNVPTVVIGSKPIDGGHLIFTDTEKVQFLEKEAAAEKYFRPYIGSREYINGGTRWILALQNVSPKELRTMPLVKKRLQMVRQFRIRSESTPTQKIADFPAQFHVTTIPEKPFLVLPEVSSERRCYAPIGYLSPPVIPSNLVKVVQEIEIFHFSILTSTIHMAWLRNIGGRLKSDYRYSVGVVYNTFPWPKLDAKAKARLTATGQAILDARAAWPEATLADLYDPDAMPANLRKAHMNNDKAVDRLYRKQAFDSERERVEHLFALYEHMTAPLAAAATPKPRRSRSRAVKT